MIQLQKISFTINKKQMELTIPSSMLLIDLIREELGLKGTKPGCLEGECGACTVLVDGEAVNSCLFPAVNIHGRDVTTIEGLADDPEGSLDEVQEAIVRHGAVQCGFCTPGVVMSIKSFQHNCEKNKINPDREEIKKSLEGNLCRCTGYVKIIDAAESVLRRDK